MANRTTIKSPAHDSRSRGPVLFSGRSHRTPADVVERLGLDARTHRRRRERRTGRGSSAWRRAARYRDLSPLYWSEIYRQRGDPSHHYTVRAAVVRPVVRGGHPFGAGHKPGELPATRTADQRSGVVPLAPLVSVGSCFTVGLRRRFFRDVLRRVPCRAFTTATATTASNQATYVNVPAAPGGA
jgi:hypothetical protein